MKPNYFRQTGFFNPAEHQRKIVVVGAGSLGSHIVYGLCKMGCSDVTVFDADKVAEHNLPNQLFTTEQVGKSKVESLQHNIKLLTETDIKVVSDVVSDDSELPMAEGCIYILATDSAESRKLVFDLIKHYPFKLIDCRSGGEGYEVYFVDLLNEQQRDDYAKTLTGKFAPLTCGEETVVYNVMSAAAEVVALVKAECSGTKHYSVLHREMNVARILGR